MSYRIMVNKIDIDYDAEGIGEALRVDWFYNAINYRPDTMIYHGPYYLFKCHLQTLMASCKTKEEFLKELENL